MSEGSLRDDALSSPCASGAISEAQGEGASSRLANELLAQIFMEASRGSTLLEDWDKPFHPRTEEAKRQHELDDLTWLGVTHVCRRWRMVALGYPLLWKKMRFGYPDMMRAIVDRSAPASLLVEWDDHRLGWGPENIAPSLLE
ncbi:hypothetical protein EVG20_g5835 [Dentipellis fragilis]|uniref:Uncharacterized protein n=1 Tax=Dentipellis fragilis TaxID=205917 RepID=A0A4Y9YUM0_9AGAM|nr:hypothetical protein EVG20_g5835 [Dentipellis fragilis]